MSRPRKSAWKRFLARHQQWAVGFVVLPLSFLNDLLQALRSFVTGAARRRADLPASRSAHTGKVARISEAVQRWAARPREGRPPLRTDRSGSSSHSVRNADKSNATRIPMGDFDEILELSLEKGTVTVEPFVTVGRLTSFLLAHDRMLEATLEMEDATLGGLALSQGMTTHSHRCGLVHDTVVRYEFVTGTGEVLDATPTQNEDVYRAAGFSHGTLGFLTALELRIVPACREAVISYTRCRSIDELHRRYQDAIVDSDAFFLEAIVYSTDHAVLIRGDLLSPDERTRLIAGGIPTNHQGRFYKPWFFRHAESVPDGHRELMPMRDYLMRHDRSMCMTMLYVFPVGNHPLVRWLFGYLIPPKVTFLKALRPAAAREEVAREQVYQDLAFPIEHLPAMVETVDRELGIFPLLVYPCRVFDRGGFIRHPGVRGRSSSVDEAGRLYLNLGVYGIPRKIAADDPDFDVLASVRTVLTRIREVGGFQHSYCDVFQTREEFGVMFDDSLATRVRARLGTSEWATVYDKVRPEIPWERWLDEADASGVPDQPPGASTQTPVQG